MKKQIKLFVLLILVAFINSVQSQVNTKPINENDTWQKPPKEIMDVLNAPLLPSVWTSPTGKYMIMADPIIYPPLEELASDMLKLAGIRVNPRNNGNHGKTSGTGVVLRQTDSVCRYGCT